MAGTADGQPTTGYQSNPSAHAGLMTDAQRQEWIQRVRASFAAKRAEEENGQPAQINAEETLAELEADSNAGRTIKVDLRLSAEEKQSWYRASTAMGLSFSEWCRDVLNAAASEILSEA